jgi:pilus assembly protein CpaF
MSASAHLDGSKAMLAHCERVLRGDLGSLYQYFDDPSVQEIMINGPENIWIERAGQFERLELSIPSSTLISAITTVANINTKSSTKSPLLDARLPGLRVAATMPPVATSGASMCIRRHSSQVRKLDTYVEQGAFDPVWRFDSAKTQKIVERPSDESIAQGGQAIADLFRWIVSTRQNLAVTGATSAGKTSLLNAIAQEIPATDRVATIEDTAELQISVPNHIGFEANPTYGVDIRSLVKHTLRYRPHRIFVGEVRGGEAFDMLDAYNTGHPGSAVSFHSDSAESGLYRLENMVRMAPEASGWPLADLRRQIAMTFPFVVHAGVLHGWRALNEVIEVIGATEDGYHTKSLFKRTVEYY